MKKSNINGYKEVIGNEGASFINAGAAMLAMQALQFVVATQGYATYSDMVLETGRIEVRAHLRTPIIPSIPKGYTYTQRSVTSQHMYDDRKHIAYELRVVTWIFKYNK
jgi:hypothetical protein